MRRLISISAALGLATIGVMAPALADSPAPGTSAESPIVVTDVSEVPEGAVEDIPSTYMTDNECATTRSWVLTIPGEHHDAVTEVQNQWVRWIDGTDEVSHQEWTLWKQTGTYHPEEVAFWANFSPNKTEGPYTGEPIPPTSPTDSERADGKWNIHPGEGGPGPKEPGLYKPSETGLGDWFYRHAAKEAWVDWTGEWIVDQTGVGEQPELPEDTNDTMWKITVETVVDVPGTDGYFEYYVENGEPTTDEDLASWIPESEGPGEGWDIHATRTVTIEEAYTDPDVVTYYAWTDGKPCDVVPPTDPKPDPDPVTPTEPQPEPTDPAPVTPTEPEKPATTPKAPVKGELPTLAQTGVGNQVLGMIGGFLLMAGVLLLALRRNAQSR